ncbi:sulfatase [Sporocytophaga myxococcoides]|uniref:sulfatase n=1 Tax=Sporocytophaga myxococcoides TaxID=153721 RepID=UPI000419CBA4|nr:sulfatase [Sporocytophaga myxococcoides]
MKFRFIQNAILLLMVALCHSAYSQKKKYNVLFIAIDNLRPQLGCYGFSNVKSPNIDKVASEGVVFEKAYCQQALCSPSRTSLLTGLNPDVTGIITIGPHFRDSLPNIVTLPQHFKNNGYFTQGFGKIFHGGLDDPRSWSVPHDQGKNPRYAPEGQAIIETKRQEKIKQGLDLTLRENRVFGPPVESYDAADNYFLDGGNTENALKALAKIKDSTFFLAVGFSNPHIPYISPKKYWDLYDRSQIKLPDNQYAPEGAPAWALQSLDELNGYHNVPKPLTDDFKRELIHGYLAATSYVDAQIGLLIDGLKKNGVYENTVIVIFGDHGYQLGQHGMWSNKHTNYETSARVTLIVKTPETKAKGQKSASIVQFVDLYPTLSDIVGLPKPAQGHGQSFKPLLTNPKKKLNTYAFSQYLKGGYYGYSVTDGRYRLVQWKKGNETVLELYDHTSDPDENKNVAGNPALKAVVASLTAQINQRIENDKKDRKILGHTSQAFNSEK